MERPQQVWVGLGEEGAGTQRKLHPEPLSQREPGREGERREGRRKEGRQCSPPALSYQLCIADFEEQLRLLQRPRRPGKGCISDFISCDGLEGTRKVPS